MNHHHHHHHHHYCCHSKKQRIKGSITVKIHISDHLHLKCISVTSYYGRGHGAISSVMLISTRSSLVSLIIEVVLGNYYLLLAFFSTLSSKPSQSDDAHFCSLTKGFSLAPTAIDSLQSNLNITNKQKVSGCTYTMRYKTYGSAVTGVPLGGAPVISISARNCSVQCT